MAFREGLEAFLIITIIIKFLEKTDNNKLKKYVGIGIALSILFSILAGLILFVVSNMLTSIENVGKLWESISSLIAVGLIITFIIWIIKHGQYIKMHIEHKTAVNLSANGITILTIFLISREGVEIALFTFAGSYQIVSIVIGIALSSIISMLILLSLIKANFKAIFVITLVYLIMQSGYLLGYGLHEGLSALKGLGYIESSNFLLAKLFDFSATIFNHKEGIIGLPLNVLFGWYSKPEWIQFAAQYLTTIALFITWIKHNNKNMNNKSLRAA